jgi:hypothetical protein
MKSSCYRKFGYYIYMYIYILHPKTLFTKDFNVSVKVRCDNMSKVKLFLADPVYLHHWCSRFCAWKTVGTLITQINWNGFTDPVLQSSVFLNILLAAGNNGGQLVVALCGFCEALAFEAISNWYNTVWPASVMFHTRLIILATSCSVPLHSHWGIYLIIVRALLLSTDKILCPISFSHHDPSSFISRSSLNLWQSRFCFSAGNGR